MPRLPGHPGVYVEEVPVGVRTISGVATSIALFIGWAARGPLDRAVRVSGFADYERHFGGLDPRTLLGHSLRHFFDNGGHDACVLRLASTTSAEAEDNVATATAHAGGLAVAASSPGAWANGVRLRISGHGAAGDDPASRRFNLEILGRTGNAAANEAFDDLSMTPGDARFAPDVVNGQSGLVTLHAAGELPVDAMELVLADGADGTAWTADDAAFAAALLESFGEGMPVDRIDLFNLACVPGLTRRATIRALQAQCRRRRAFLLVDAPQDMPVESMIEAPTDAITLAPDARNSAIFHPSVLAEDPLTPGTVRAFPPCGFVAGVYARIDASRGVWKAAAGTDCTLRGAAGLTQQIDDQRNGTLNPMGVNCLRRFPGRGTLIWGARTLEGHDRLGSEWKYVPVRRMALFLEESVRRGLQWTAFEANDEPLRAQIRTTVEAFVHDLFRQGAFQGASPREAYMVKCDRGTTTQADVREGIVNLLLGFAPIKPGEFVMLQIPLAAADASA